MVDVTRTKSTSPVPWAMAVAQGIALFLGGFSLLNFVIEWRTPGYDADLWWIDFAPFPLFVERALLLVVAILFITFGLRPELFSGRRRWVVRGAVGLLTVVLAWDAVNFFLLVHRGRIQTTFPVPFTLFVMLAIWGVWFAAGGERRARGPAGWAVMVFSVGACAVGLPLLQMLCFGLTDYRRPADVAVVFGARVYDDGTPSVALEDRTQLAIDLYKQGLVKTLLFSGGPNAVGINETDAMRRMALKAGVKAEDIECDPAGLNTDATATNTVRMLGGRFGKGQPQVLAVSHFYHMPRVKMAFGERGWEVYTVPVRKPLVGTRRFMAREVVALWKYYLEGLVPRGR